LSSLPLADLRGLTLSRCKEFPPNSTSLSATLYVVLLASLVAAEMF
jgi:hypothetical protein